MYLSTLEEPKHTQYYVVMNTKTNYFKLNHCAVLFPDIDGYKNNGLQHKDINNFNNSEDNVALGILVLSFQYIFKVAKPNKQLINARQFLVHLGNECNTSNSDSLLQLQLLASPILCHTNPTNLR